MWCAVDIIRLGEAVSTKELHLNHKNKKGVKITAPKMGVHMTELEDGKENIYINEGSIIGSVGRRKRRFVG